MSEKELISFFSNLHEDDKKQLEVITSTNKRILVEAPAGYGKTNTMVSKIAFLIASGRLPSPKKILALTYSVNAAHKIKKDVSEKIPEIMANLPSHRRPSKNIVFATNYHGFCRRVLRLYGFTIDPWLKNIEITESISDESEQEINRLALGIAYKDMQVLSYFGKAVKEKNLEFIKENNEYYLSLIQKYFLPNGYISFNAILLFTTSLFRQNINILRQYQRLFPSIIVDEFQDTNILSMNLVDKLIGKHTEITLMGDSLQQIYGFIGAIPNILDKAKKRYDLHKIELEINYRFRNNKKLLLLDAQIRENAKNLKSPNIQNKLVLDCDELDTQNEEARFILQKVKEVTSNHPNDKVVILVSGRGQNVNLILECLTENDFPFFYALFRDEDKDYITFHKICLSSLFKVLKSKDKFTRTLSSKVFRLVLEHLETKKLANDDVYNSLLVLLKTMFNKLFSEYKFLSATEKAGYVKDVFENKTLKQFIGNIQVQVVVSTVHGAKGLEWDFVLIPDMEKNQFPNYFFCRSCGFQESCNIDWADSKVDNMFLLKYTEMLSLFYVATTRARKDVYFSYSKKSITPFGSEPDTNRSCLLSLGGFELNLSN